MTTTDNVIGIKPEEIIEEPLFRFVGNRFTLNVHHLAYVLNIIGITVPLGIYEKMPDEIKKHFMAIKV